jgi:5'-3' exonuclease
VRVHLIDGTYELFRQFLAPRPGHTDAGGTEVGATRAVVSSMLTMLEDGATHLGVATDHVIESFRNDLWETYKTGEGIDPLLREQFPMLEDALTALGVTVWPMVDYEADDALASAAMVAAADDRVEQVIICTPDKDLGQCVGGKVVQLDRRRDTLLDADGVREKFGVPPASIPDWLALVGDTADGYPGLPGWGAKSAAMVLARYRHLEHIPALAMKWDVPVRGALRLATTLTEHAERARLFRELATLRPDAPIGTDVDALRWTGPRDDFASWSERLGTPALHARATALAAVRAAGTR